MCLPCRCFKMKPDARKWRFKSYPGERLAARAGSPGERTRAGADEPRVRGGTERSLSSPAGTRPDEAGPGDAREGARPPAARLPTRRPPAARARLVPGRPGRPNSQARAAGALCREAPRTMSRAGGRRPPPARGPGMTVQPRPARPGPGPRPPGPA